VRDDFKPLPRHVQWWRRTRNQRLAAYKSFESGVRKLLTLAISVVGAILISYGVHEVYPPAGFVTGGIMCWLLLWSHEQDKRRRE
jgi:hypothetical protein